MKFNLARPRVVAGLIAAGLAALASAQEPQEAGQPIVGFGGLRLSSAPQTGSITFGASRASVWSDDATTQRILLRGDVRVQLGVYAFAASRAVVWLERLEDSKTNPGNGVYQIAVYFDRVSDPSAAAGVSQSGDRLLVTALVDGDPSLRADALRSERPQSDAFIAEADQRLDHLITTLSAPAGAGETASPRLVPGSGVIAGGTGPIVPGMSQPYEPGSLLERQLITGLTPGERQTIMDELGPAERLQPIFAKDGLINLAAGQEFSFVPGAGAEDENTIIVSGGVVVESVDLRNNRTLQISADRAVVFMAPGKPGDYRHFKKEMIRGIYLEGNVVGTDGKTTLRGPRVYYDVQANQAVVVDAVFHTYDARRGLPLYVRAKTLRQTAQNQIQAKDVTLANSSFFEPHLSIGATSITVTQEKQPAGQPDRFYIEGKDLTLRAGTTPFFYYPSFAGDLERFPLKEVRFENSSDSGFAIKTAFDLFGLLGFDPPKGIRADLLVDGYSKRGIAFGLEGGYNLGTTRGSFLAYILPSDEGRDTLTSGEHREFTGQTRGLLVADHRWFIDDKWAVFLEGSYISDATFVDAFYEPLAETRREFANAAYLRRIDGNSVVGFLGKGSVNNFTPNEYLLQSQGYTVDKLPEISYTRVQDDLLSALAPGLLTYSSEYRFSNMAFNFTNKTPADFGFTTTRLSQDAFGLNPTDNIGAMLRALGYTENQVLRFDTRHEITLPLHVGAVNVTPFGAARFTAYDTDFDSFSGQSQEKYRIWSGEGVRTSTSLQHIDDGVDSQFFDLHRVRHIIEPSVTGWVGATSIEQSRLPVFDDTVESIADGAVVKIGLNQVFQTQHSGEGRWHTVDWLKLNTEVVYASNDTPRESPIMRFFDYRPEYSQLGEFGTVDAAWQVTDATALTFNTVYDLDMNQPARTSSGVLIQHTPDFSTFVEAHYINARDATYVSAGADYRLTDKYTLGVVAVYDVDVSDFQELSARLNREFPNFVIALKVRYNNITDEVGFGIVLQPLSRDYRKQNLQRLGRDRLDAGDTNQGEPPTPVDRTETFLP